MTCCRIEDIERNIRFVLDEIGKSGVPDIASGVVSSELENFLANADAYKLDALELEVKDLHMQFSHFRANNVDMLAQRNSAIEEKYVAFAASIRLHGNEDLGSSSESFGPVFSNLAGVILQADQDRFARTIFRATRGNAFTEFHPIPELLHHNDGSVLKSVFLIYFQGGEAMSGKVSRICASFSASIYAWPKSERAANEQIANAEEMISEKKTALEAFEKFLVDESAYLFKLVREGGNSLVEEWKMFCSKEKAIYACLNLFEGDVTLRADCWFVHEEEAAIRDLIGANSGSGRRGSGPEMSAMLIVDNSTDHAHAAPTYIKTNDVTRSFQLIVDTYGVPRYKEANPALFAVVSFPFLFGIMFGDVGHGFMLMMVGLWAVMNKVRAPPALVEHRYMVVAMGFFAIYAGLLYSEFFAIGINLFGSRWSCVGDSVCEPTFNISNAKGTSLGGPYPFGIDPAWDVSSNQLIYVNSMKMKISVLFGVVQMLLGIGLKFSNSIYFKNWLDLIFECVPQLLFMLTFFGYMDWMIMYKWVSGTDLSPGLIDTMITMGLTGGGVKTALFPGQEFLQSVFFKIILFSVPLMLFPKPLILLWQNKSAGQRHGHEEDRQNLISSTSGSFEKTEPEFEFGEVFIHQAIETIEFVLGTVSHTASYLRLWALSLAHQQLSLVFLEKTLYAAMSSDWPMFFNAIPIYIGFAVFIGVTVGILLGMDVMECFLHTLRLHWVEFQSKFYKADGIKFKPFGHLSGLEEVRNIET